MYFTPYREDAEEALQELRREVFRSGEYRKPGEGPDFGSVLSDPEFQRKASIGSRLLLWAIDSFFATRGFLHWAARGFRNPASIEQAIEWTGEQGTHSILDITRTATIRDYGVAIPLSAPLLRRWFGTTEPTREQVEEASGKVGFDVPRGQAVYFPVYQDGEPRELAFIGASGD